MYVYLKNNLNNNNTFKRNVFDLFYFLNFHFSHNHNLNNINSFVLWDSLVSFCLSEFVQLQSFCRIQHGLRAESESKFRI